MPHRVNTRRVLGVAALVLAGAVSAGPAVATSGSDPCPWVRSQAPVETRVAMVLGRMTLADKVSMVHGITTPAQSVGVQPGAPPYVGVVAAIPRLCLPALKMEDGPAGVGDGMTGVTQLPAPVAAASTWDTTAVTQYGAVVGAEEWAKGANITLSPTVNIVRDPRWGRSFEAFGEDPYLTAQLGAADIEGIQSQGPMAQVKHLAAYNEETFRDTAVDDALVSPRVLHEIYLPAFKAAVQQAGVASAMCAYNEVNQVRACASPYLLSQVLKGEFGFPGFVTSDWFAITSSAASVNAGLDVQMPDGCLLGSQLEPEVQAGTVPVSRLDDMVRRILREMFRFDLFRRPQPGGPASVVTGAAHAALARAVAEEGTVLLKNAGPVLPLDAGRVRTIAVIGADAGTDAQTGGGGSAKVVAPYVVTPYRGIARRAAGRARVTYDDGTDPAAAAAAARTADVAVVFASQFAEEDRDQLTLELPAAENALISTVAAANPNTVVVLNTASAVVMPWLDQVRGLIEAWYPGQEDGDAIAAVLFGDVNPSGKLPVTFPASQVQLPTASPDRWPGVAGGAQYSEGLFVGYRWYDANGLAPAFPFGYGLSYTTFAFRHLALGAPASADGRQTVQVDVTNTGPRAGADVVQLYVSDPRAAGEPPRQLKGFQRVFLAPGQTARVAFTLDPSSLSSWDPTLSRWEALPGRYVVAVGDSSRSLPLQASFVLSGPLVTGTATPPPPPSPPAAASPSTAASDAAACWQDDLGTLVNGGLSITGESQPGNPSELPAS